jgi:hypothetical protein
MHLSGANIPALSCGLLIDMMQATQDRFCDDFSAFGSTYVDRRRAGGPLPIRAMRAPAIKIIDVLCQNLLQMALVENQQVIQTLGSDRSHPGSAIALARGDLNGVRPRLRTP